MRFLRPSCLIPVLLLTACGYPQNDPYPAGERGTNTLYSAFTERPKHLDPARSYSEDESVFTAQIYEAPLQYHYLKRPYALIPAAAEAVPHPYYLDAAGERLPDSAPAETIAHSVYEVRIRPASATSRTRRSRSMRPGSRSIRRLTRKHWPASIRWLVLNIRERASWSPTTTSTRSSGWRIRACIRRSSA